MIFDTWKAEERIMGENDAPHAKIKLGVLSFRTGRSAINQASKILHDSLPKSHDWKLPLEGGDEMLRTCRGSRWTPTGIYTVE